LKPTRRMPGLEGAARELRGIIGKGAFIRRDRLRRALFLSDYPRLRAGEAPAVTGRLGEAGWRLTLSGGLALLDWPLTRYAAFFACLDKAPGRGEDEPGLCPILRLHEAPMAEGMLDEARQVLLMWAGDEKKALKRRAEDALGTALRQKEKVPAFYRILIQADHRMEE
jgi:hypothetical protein